MFSATTTLFILLPLVCLVYAAVRVARIGKRAPGLPPGPPTVPLLGNLNIFPKSQAHYQFTEWSKTYGDIYSLKIASGTAIVLSSMAAVNEVLEVKSGLTADRPAGRVLDLVTDGLNMVLARYGNSWRTMRRVAHTLLTPQACLKHIPIQRAESYQLMYDMLKKPEDFHNSVRRFTFSTTISVLFGKRVPQWNSPEFRDFFHMQKKWQAVMTPGATPPIDIFPILQYIPARWAPWKAACAEVRDLQHALYGGLLSQCERRLSAGTPNGCFMEGVLDRREEFGITEPQLMRIGGVLIGAGAESTSSHINTLILAMVCNPDVLKRVQEEIDQLIGPDRLPTLDDVANLPYYQAVISETHRWRPTNPIAMPHAALEDLTYKGYLIPKGATIFPNNWGIFHDEKTFDSPSDFIPERFLNPAAGGSKAKVIDKDRKHHAGFGYGRRICPGVHIVDNAVGLSVLTFLWGFNCKKAVDPETKQIIEPDTWNFSKGITTGPNPFKCDITPRSQHHADLIEQAYIGSTEVFQTYEYELSEDDRKHVETIRASF